MPQGFHADLLSRIEKDSIKGSGLGSWLNGILDVWIGRLSLTDDSCVPQEIRDVAAKEGRFAATIVQLIRGTPSGEFLVARSGAESRLAAAVEDWYGVEARKALKLLQGIWRIKGNVADYFTRWLAIAESKVAEEPTLTPWQFIELCGRAMAVAREKIKRHRATPAMLRAERGRLRRDAGRKNTTGRRGEDIESVALYLWLVLRVRHGWTDDKASKMLYKFMMKGRNGLTGNSKGETVRCHIWPTVASGRSSGTRKIPPWHTAFSPRMRRAVRQLAALPRKPGPFDAAERRVAASLKTAAK